MTEETKAGVPAAPKRSDFVPLNKVTNLAELFKHPDFKQRLAAAVPKHFNSERLLRTMVQAVQKTPKLADVNPMSMLGACITLAALGLEPNTPLGHAHLIPFEVKKWNSATREREHIRTDVQVIIGYPGYLDLIYRGDKVKDLHCDVFWPDEVASGAFSYEYGSKKHLTHKPSGKARAPGEEPAGAYMYATLHNGGEEFTVLSLADLHATRARSQGFQAAMYAYEDAQKHNKDPNKDKRYSEAPWIKDFIQMYKKTALRSGQKWLPKSVELAAAITIDGEAETGAIDFSKIVEGNQILDGSYEAETQLLTEEHTVPLDLGKKQPEAEPVPRGQEVKPKATKAAADNRRKPPETEKSAPAHKANPPGERVLEATAFRDGHMDGPEKLTYPLFNAFGEEDDGPSGPATDPVKFAERFAAEFSDSDESGQEALAEYNSDAIQDAVAASEEAAKIISNVLKQTAAPEAATKEQKPNFEELYYQPVAKNAKGFWDQVEWVKKAKAVMSEITDVDHLKGFFQVNADLANSLATTARTVYMNYYANRMEVLAPPTNSSEPPPTDEDDPGPDAEPPHEDHWTGVFQQLKRDFLDCGTVHDLEALTKNVAVKAQLRQLKENRPDLAVELEGFYGQCTDKLKGK